MPRQPPADDDGRRVQWSSWLRTRMDERRLSVRVLADLCGVTSSSVQQWRTGSYPTLEVAPLLARALGVSVRELVDRAAGELRNAKIVR